MEKEIQDLLRRKEKAKQMGGQAMIDRQHSLGRLTARERIDRFVDPDTFMELGMLNHSEHPDFAQQSPCDGLITGLGHVSGRPAVISAADKTVLAASEGMVFLRKNSAVNEYAVKRGLPIFRLGEGGGLRIPDGMGSDGISQTGFPEHLLTSCRTVPQITSIMGDSYGLPTWDAVSSDFAVQVKGTCMAIASHRMLEVALSETITPEELGGWKIHAETTGQVDAFADDDDHCMGIMKEFFSYLPSNASQEPPFKKTLDDPYRLLDDVVDIVPTRLNRAYDMKKLIKVLVDDGIFFELKEFFGKALITGLAHLNGRVVGIFANQPMFNAGAAGPQECDKAIEFICLCDSFNIPMVFLNDIPGFYIGAFAEKNKMPTKIMTWLRALALASVPKMSVVIRKSIGAAYFNMSGPFMGADFLVAWPTAHISFTGDEVAVNVVYGRQLAEAENPATEREKLMDQLAHDSAPYKAAGKHFIDDVIDPRDTRKFLCRALEFSCANKGSMSKRTLANWPMGY
ncbi:MAG: methylmalonyl-CoA decarboxylase [Deltaproteobacteria bacterium]|nr:methylmalonyl-CoA decarboxylase [Deltaproteobacteria bacterium]